MESLLEADCDGHSIDRVYQQAGVFRADCLAMARYLGHFYLEYEFYAEAEVLYGLLLDVLRQQERQQPETCRRLFTVEVQAEVYVAYGRVLEQKKQYARAVTILDTACQLYQRWIRELAQQIDEGERELRLLRAELAAPTTPQHVASFAADGDGDGAEPYPSSSSVAAVGATRLSPLETTLKRMLVTSKEEQIRQWRVQWTEAQATAEDCREQLQYATSLYTLSS